MQGEKARSGKRRGRIGKRLEQPAETASADESTALRSDFIPEQLATLTAIETLIGDLELTGEQAAIGEEMLIELQGACSELAALNTGPTTGAKEIHEAARRVSALAETFSGLVDGAVNSSATGRGGNA